jgi:hypothetical protein
MRYEQPQIERRERIDALLRLDDSISSDTPDNIN